MALASDIFDVRVAHDLSRENPITFKVWECQRLHHYLNPQANGTVNIDYEQTWLVTGGGIPWITIGMPNPYFNITSFGENVAQASNASSGSWYGVRLDLDKNYLPNETFKIKLSTNQQELIEGLPDQSKWRMIFTTGWYDNCGIDNMTIKLISHSDPDSYTFNPLFQNQEDNAYYWIGTNLPRGAKATISIESTDGAFITENITNPAPIQPSHIGCGVVGWGFLILLAILIIGLIIISIINKRKESEYIEQNLPDFEKKFPKTDEDELKDRIKEKREIEDDEATGYVPPMLWIAAHPYSSSTGHFKGFSGGSGGESGGGGAGGGWSSSCACVSCACACACACAGGGAAGCTNKFNLEKQHLANSH
jgi:uncharacterized membrane protein YgcG